MDTVHKLKGSELTARHWIASMLSRLCKDSPLSAHCYAIYYLTRRPSRTEILVLASGGSIKSYALIRYGGEFTIEDVYEIHLWNPTNDVVAGINISPDKRVDIQLHDNTSIGTGEIIDHFRSLGFREFHVEEFYDMICGRESFNPSPLEGLAIKLGEKHAYLYKDLELERGIEMTMDEAREILKEYTHYGVIVDYILASIAARYVTLPWNHVIGGVFTRKEYRGRGYAKAVTSALTREAVASGAYAGLHVEVDNEPAIRVYKALGYRVLKTRTWIFAHP